jgi:hypothetical protein
VNGDPYALTATSTIPTSSTSGPPSQTMPPDVEPPATTPIDATASAATSSVQPASALATVQLSAPAGQYRPGGTSSYSAAGAEQQVEIATRPSSPTVTTPPQPVTSSPGSAPWTPPAAAPSNPGTRTY